MLLPAGGDTALEVVKLRGTDAAGAVGTNGTVIVTVTLGVQLEVEKEEDAATVTVLVTLRTHDEEEGLISSNSRSGLLGTTGAALEAMGLGVMMGAGTSEAGAGASIAWGLSDCTASGACSATVSLRGLLLGEASDALDGACSGLDSGVG